jgi:PAS domain S-box-containing protein
MKTNLQEDEMKAQAIFNASVDGIILIDAKGKIESINPAACELFGYSLREVVGRNINFLMSEPHQHQYDAYLECDKGIGKKNIIGVGREVEGLRKDGSTFPFRLSISEVKLDSKTIFTGFIHDIGEQKKAEEKLLVLTERLENKVKERTEDLAQVIAETQFVNQQLQEEVAKRKEAEKEAQRTLKKELELGELKSRFVSMASHEFRTPLTSILSSITLIGKYDSPDQEEKKQKHVQRISTSVHNLINILNDFFFRQIASRKNTLQSSRIRFT